MAEEVKDTKKEAPAAQATEPAKKKNNNTVIIVIIAVVVVLFVLPALAIFGLGFVAKKKIEQVGKDGISIDGGNVKIDTGDNQKWPKTLPTDVPEFSGGKIVSSSKFGEVWTIIFSDVQSGEVEAYRTKVASSGWTIDNETDLGTVKMYVAKKGQYMLNFNYSASDKGLNISVSKVTE